MTQAATQPEQMILRMLAETGRSPAPAPEATDVKDYDWQSPCGFTAPQLARLTEIAQKAGQEMSVVLSSQIREEVALQPAAPVQRYAEQLVGGEEEAQTFYARLLTDRTRCCGFVAVPAQPARQWVSKLLGAAAAGEGDFSALESAILTDILAALLGAFGRPLQDVGGRPVECEQRVRTELELSAAGPGEGYTILAYQGAAEGDAEILRVVVQSDLLAPVVGAAGAAGGRSRDQIHKDVLACIEQVEVRAEAWVGRTELTMRELMTLSVGDVLMTDLKPDRLVTLTVAGRAVLIGHPVRCAGRYGVQVVGAASSDAAAQKEA